MKLPQIRPKVCALGWPTGSIQRRSGAKRGFTIVELLAVVAIMVVMMTFLVPAVSGIKGNRDLVSQAYEIAGALEQARTYAMANNTYTWVGFYEEDGAVPWKTGAAPAGDGRVLVSVIASKDGTRYKSASETVPAQQVMQLSKLYKFENVRLTDPNNGSQWPQVDADYQVGQGGFQSSSLAFKYPLTGTTQPYTFRQIIEFNPLGEATKIAATLSAPPQDWIGLGLYPTRGSTDDPKYANIPPTAVLIEGLSGEVKVFKP